MKKLLIVSYFFPPFNNIASRRWAEMIPRLERDFDVYVYTFNSTGDLKVPIQEAKIKRFGFLSNVRFNHEQRRKNFFTTIVSQFTRNLRTLDSTFRTFYLKGRKSYFSLLREIKPDIVLTTAGPFSALFFGYESKIRNRNILWVIDFRDSMSLYTRSSKNFVKRKIDSFIDKKVTSKADLILSVSNTLSEILGNFYERIVYTIHNGFEKRNHQFTDKVPNDAIKIYYAGQIYPHQEPSLTLLLGHLEYNNNYELQVRLLGDSNRVMEIKNLVQGFQNAKVFILNPAERKTVDLEKSSADYLLILEDLFISNQVSKGTLTGKLFEYLPYKSPILAICRPDSEIKNILKITGRGDVVSSISGLENFFELKKNFKSTKKVDDFSREAQAERFIKILNQKMH